MAEVLEKSGYLHALEASGTIEDEGRIENLNEFLSAAQDYQQQTGDDSLEGFLETITLATDVDNFEEERNAVTLMTLHAAKGLEFPVVFIVGMEEGLFPHQRSLDRESDLEEERRLCYVGMTRAQRALYLSRARVRRRQGYHEETLCSRFIDEIPPDYLALVESPLGSGLGAFGVGSEPRWRPPEAPRMPQIETGTPPRRPSEVVPRGPSVSTFTPEPEGEAAFLRPNARVLHPRFGAGRVLRVEGQGESGKVVVQFEDGQEKTLLVGYARLKPLSE
ncbi:MAG: hypothetical protein KatS3mg115_1309 [Candidatus Poribacteria bacterium]|nr:MAG: hypothetical protein KatS3mg115_1309 [Candidatus Poribacteria bacterium]